MPGTAAKRILADVDASWQPIAAALASMNDGDIERALPSGWTGKELLSHLAFWSEAVEGYVTLALRLLQLPDGWSFGSGYVPDPNAPWPHFQEHNDREAAWGLAHSAAEVRGRMERAHAGLVTFLATITDEERAANEQYFRDIAGHYREHTPEIAALREK